MFWPPIARFIFHPLITPSPRTVSMLRRFNSINDNVLLSGQQFAANRLRVIVRDTFLLLQLVGCRESTYQEIRLNWWILSDIVVMHNFSLHSNGTPGYEVNIYNNNNNNGKYSSYFTWLSYLKWGTRIWSVIYCFTTRTNFEFTIYGIFGGEKPCRLPGWMKNLSPTIMRHGWESNLPTSRTA